MYKTLFLIRYILLIAFIAFSCEKSTKPVFDNIPASKKFYDKILILGNSITHHSPYPQIGWYGDWGMAASCEERDYVHILKNLSLTENNTCKFMLSGLSDFEHNLTTYDYCKLDTFIKFQPELFILNIGENVHSHQAIDDNFGIYLDSLINYIKNTNQMEVLCVGSFWPRPVVEKIMEEVSLSNNCNYIKLSDLYVDANRALQYEHSGIACHPNDSGMVNIARRIWQNMVYNQVE